MLLLETESEKRLSGLVTLTFYALKAIGLAPFSQELKAFRFSKIGLVYNVAILILLQLMDGIALPTFFSLVYPNRTPVTQAIDVAQCVVGSIATNVIAISWIFRQKTGVRVINRLLETERLLSGVEKQPVAGERMGTFFAVHTAFTACLWTTCRTTSALTYPGTLSWLFYSVSNLVIYTFIIEYSLVVGLVARQLERVNKNLSRLDGLPDRLSRLNPIKLLLTIRTTIYDLAKDTADFFSFPILISIGHFLTLLIYNVYYLIYTLLSPNGLASPMTVANGVGWILIVLYPITMLSSNVTKAVKEAKLTGWTVHKLLAKSTRRETKAELRGFSLQLLHEHLRFTAYGFFSLDCTMLNSILQATAIYNVILIQFSQPGNTV